jgi:hypothetical protein
MRRARHLTALVVATLVTGGCAIGAAPATSAFDVAAGHGDYLWGIMAIVFGVALLLGGVAAQQRGDSFNDGLGGAVGVVGQMLVGAVAFGAIYLLGVALGIVEW